MVARKRKDVYKRQEYIKLCAQLAAQASATGYEALIFCEADRKRVGQAVTCLLYTSRCV